MPKNILDNIESYGAVWGDESYPVPSHIGKGGGNTTGYVAYKVIEISFKNPIGKSKVTNMIVGIRKRTSGPDTGYLVIDLSASHYRVLLKPVTGEFWSENPEDKLKEMFNKEVESYLK
jgi:hypothetical protein